jgi:predicted RNA-binding protein (virulence factor B family)
MDQQDEELEVLVGKCDLFKVISVTKSGAFVNAGQTRDVFVPMREQLKALTPGEWHIIYVYRDEQKGRITGSMMLNKHLYEDAPLDVKEGDLVDLLIYTNTDMGYKAVVNGDSWGVLYKNEIFQELKQGQKIKGYIKKIRPDGKMDLMLEKPGFQSVPDLSERIINHLKAAGGRSPLTDQTPPEEIYKLFGVSKKKFKMAIGNLYKKRIVILEQGSIQLVQDLKKRNNVK